MAIGTFRRAARLISTISITAASIFVAGTAVGVTTAISASNSAGADTPSFVTTCDVPSVGNVQFPTTVQGSIPQQLPNGTSFGVSDFTWEVTVPSTIASDIVAEFGTGSTISSTISTDTDASGTIEGSQSTTVNFGSVTVNSGAAFTMNGAGSTAGPFTATGASVVVTPGPTIDAFTITVTPTTGPDAGIPEPQPPFTCTTPSSEPIIAFAEGVNGPFAYVGNGNSDNVSVIDTNTNTVVGSPIHVAGGPGWVAITPDGSTAVISNATSGGTLSEIDTATNSVIRTISVYGTGARGLAISPDGATAWVTGGNSDSQLVPIDLATGAVGTGIDVGGGAAGLAITPDGSTALVVNQLDGTVSVVDLTSRTVTDTIDTGFSLPPEVEVAPNGQTAYVDGPGELLPIDLSGPTPTTEAPISVCAGPDRMAISPDSTTAWVGCSGAGSLADVNLVSDSAQIYSLGQGGSDGVAAVSVTPDGSTVYADDQTAGVVIPFDVGTLTAEPGIPVGSAPYGLAITPDQGPSAVLTSNVLGTTSMGTSVGFDASRSAQGSSPIVSYAWNFGDGGTDLTPTPTDTHTYAADGSYTATVTETDADGASTTELYGGQGAFLHGSTAAIGSVAVSVVNAPCTANDQCMATLSTSSTPLTPAESISVDATLPEDGTLTVTSEPGALRCTTKHFAPVGNVSSYSTTSEPSADVQVTLLLTGATSTTGVKVCFQSTTPPAHYLKTCSKNVAAPCLSGPLTLAPGGVEATVLVPPGDPRFRLDGGQAIQELTESAKSISPKGVIGKTMKIKGTDLLGSNGQTKPTAIDFTSVSGSTVTASVVSVTATQIVVLVPNGAATGPVSLVWPDEILITEGDITIT